MFLSSKICFMYYIILLVFNCAYSLDLDCKSNVEKLM